MAIRRYLFPDSVTGRGPITSTASRSMGEATLGCAMECNGSSFGVDCCLDKPSALMAQDLVTNLFDGLPANIGTS